MSYNRWINYERHLIIVGADIFRNSILVMKRDIHTKSRGLILVNFLVCSQNISKTVQIKFLGLG